MYSTSDNYKSKIYLPSTKHLLRIFINDVEVNPKHILDIKPSHYLFPDEKFMLGATPSKCIDLKLHKNSIPSAINKIYITSGIVGEEIPIRIF